MSGKGPRLRLHCVGLPEATIGYTAILVVRLSRAARVGGQHWANSDAFSVANSSNVVGSRPSVRARAFGFGEIEGEAPSGANCASTTEICGSIPLLIVDRSARLPPIRARLATVQH
ncbi:hypothetical protein ABH922_004460 [Rhodococcus sp. 27YEA15]